MYVLTKAAEGESQQFLSEMLTKDGEASPKIRHLVMAKVCKARGDSLWTDKHVPCPSDHSSSPSVARRERTKCNPEHDMQSDQAPQALALGCVSSGGTWDNRFQVYERKG